MDITITATDVVILLSILLANVWIIKRDKKEEERKWKYYLDGAGKEGITDFVKIKQIYDRNEKKLNKRRGISL